MKRSQLFLKEPSKVLLSVRKGTRKSMISSKKRSLSSIRCITKLLKLHPLKTRSLEWNQLRVNQYPTKFLRTEILKRQWKLPERKRRLKRTLPSRQRKSTCVSKKSSRSKKDKKSKKKRKRIKKMRKTIRRLRLGNLRRRTNKKSKRWKIRSVRPRSSEKACLVQRRKPKKKELRRRSKRSRRTENKQLNKLQMSRGMRGSSEWKLWRKRQMMTNWSMLMVIFSQPNKRWAKGWPRERERLINSVQSSALHYGSPSHP